MINVPSVHAGMTSNTFKDKNRFFKNLNLLFKLSV